MWLSSSWHTEQVIGISSVDGKDILTIYTILPSDKHIFLCSLDNQKILFTQLDIFSSDNPSQKTC